MCWGGGGTQLIIIIVIVITLTTTITIISNLITILSEVRTDLFGDTSFTLSRFLFSCGIWQPEPGARW